MRKMQTVGIITIHMTRNYGAVLQAYALNKYIRTMGFDVKTIDFRTDRTKDSYKIFYRIKNLKDIVRNIHVFFYSIKLHIKNKKFKNFIESQIPQTKSAFFSNEQIEKSDISFDYYICGSDQIWNTFCDNFNEAFLLKFAHDKGVRISYAVSLGKPEINEKLRDIFKYELAGFKALSVRELDSVEVINKLCGKVVEHVFDPVFLISKEEWSLFSRNIPQYPYIFFYSVKGDIPEMRKYVNDLRKLTGLPIVVVNYNIRHFGCRFKKMYNAGPIEFLGLIKNASYICTNSFHATAFSIIFNKQFISFAGEGASRIKSLLECCGLEGRCSLNNATVNEMLNPIDYKVVNSITYKYIEKSKMFLKRELELNEI